VASAVARRHGISNGLLYAWRRKFGADLGVVSTHPRVSRPNAPMLSQMAIGDRTPRRQAMDPRWGNQVIPVERTVIVVKVAYRSQFYLKWLP